MVRRVSMASARLSCRSRASAATSFAVAQPGLTASAARAEASCPAVSSAAAWAWASDRCARAVMPFSGEAFGSAGMAAVRSARAVGQSPASRASRPVRYAASGWWAGTFASRSAAARAAAVSPASISVSPRASSRRSPSGSAADTSRTNSCPSFRRAGVLVSYRTDARRRVRVASPGTAAQLARNTRSAVASSPSPRRNATYSATSGGLAFAPGMDW